MTIASRTFAATLKIGPAATRTIAVQKDVPISAPDNARLLTDVYLARPKSPRPVILLRSPYGRAGAYGTMARLFAERGYHAVVQSTRGTFGSEGRIDFDREAADGRAAADWIVGAALVQRRPRHLRRKLLSVSPSSPSPPPGRPS